MVLQVAVYVSIVIYQTLPSAAQPSRENYFAQKSFWKGESVVLSSDRSASYPRVAEAEQGRSGGRSLGLGRRRARRLSQANDGAAAVARPRRKFSLRQSLDNSQNAERISICLSPPRNPEKPWPGRPPPIQKETGRLTAPLTPTPAPPTRSAPVRRTGSNPRHGWNGTVSAPSRDWRRRCGRPARPDAG